MANHRIQLTFVGHLTFKGPTGPDGISNKLLREAAVSISQPLSELFNYSLSTGYFPETWKSYVMQ